MKKKKHTPTQFFLLVAVEIYAYCGGAHFSHFGCCYDCLHVKYGAVCIRFIALNRMGMESAVIRHSLYFYINIQLNY